MKELKLPVEKHPHPYTIGWIKAAEKIEVNERCKVPFSIGKYRDEVYCDVVEMDAHHLLLGRHWQFDSDARHPGRNNVYRLEKDGVSFTLFLLTSGSRPKVKHKVGVSTEEADDSKRRASLLLLQKNEIVEVNQLKDRASKFLGCFWKLLWKMDRLPLGSSCIQKVQKT